jgi:predicted DNA-binding transcriptional regulator YafY
MAIEDAIKDAMQINRLFEIIYILLDKKSVTAKEFAEHFEVSVRTIYRDIDILSSAGIPIYTSQGKGGGISLLDDYILNKSVLSENEQNEILFALQSLTAAQKPGADPVLAKLSRLFNKNQANWIEVDLAPWGSSKTQTSEFTVLKEAILNQQRIQFEYINSSGEKSRRYVEPVKLIFKVNAWYLQGFCLSRNTFRTFKISRMSKIETMQEHFDKRPEPPEEAQENSTQKWIPIVLKGSAQGAYRILDEFDENAITQESDGSYTVTAMLPESKWLIGYLLSFGTDIEVLEPAPIRALLQGQVEALYEKYHSGL